MPKLLLLPGDGIGPEIVAEAERIIAVLNRDFSLEADIEYGLLGGCSFDEHGVPLTDETLARAKQSDAVLMGSVGGPPWASVAASPSGCRTPSGGYRTSPTSKNST